MAARWAAKRYRGALGDFFRAPAIGIPRSKPKARMNMPPTISICVASSMLFTPVSVYPSRRTTSLVHDGNSSLGFQRCLEGVDSSLTLISGDPLNQRPEHLEGTLQLPPSRMMDPGRLIIEALEAVARPPVHDGHSQQTYPVVKQYNVGRLKLSDLAAKRAKRGFVGVPGALTDGSL